jgi:phage-related protein
VQGMLDKQDEFVAGLTETFNWLMTTLEPVGNLISTVFMGIYTVLETFFTGPLFQQIVTTVIQITGTIIEKFSYVADMLTPIVDDILGIVNEIVSYLSEKLAPVVKGVTDVLTGPEVTGAFNAVVDLIGSVLSLALEVVKIGWDALVVAIEWAQPIFETVFSVFEIAFTTVMNVIKIGVPVITELFKGIVAYLKGDTEGAFTNLGTKASEAWEGIVLTIDGAKTRILIKIVALIDGIKTKFDEMVTAALDFGKDIVQGLIDGINSKIAEVLAAATNLIDELKKKFTIKFDFGSPSKVMEEMGGWVGEGLAIGMDKSTKDVLQAATNMVYAAQAPMMAATGGSSVTNVTNNYTLGVSTSASPTVIMRSYDLMRGSI